MPNRHSLCIINLDNYQSQGTRWVACAPSHENRKILWYFDSFGMHYLRNMSSEPKRMVWKRFIIQFRINISKVSYAVINIYFLHRWSFGEDYYDILQTFSINDVNYNERFIEQYFKLIKSIYIEYQKNSVYIARKLLRIMWISMGV